MNFLKKIIDFLQSHNRLVKITTTCVLSALFLGTIALSIFSGGEIVKSLQGDQIVEEVKGLLSIKDAKYRSSYIAGDKFSFEKEDSLVQLYAKDPLIDGMVMIDELPDSEYGFQVNGTGDIILEADDITMSTDIQTIDVVSVVYPTLRETIEVEVLKGIDSTKLTSSLLLEAENANLYQSGILLTREEMCTLPDTNKPYISSEGSTVDGASCSGGACLRNFQSSDMLVEFIVIAAQDVTVDVTVSVCKRKDAATFGDWFNVTLNDNEVTSIESQSVPSGTGYFEPFTLQSVSLSLRRGINEFKFHSGSVAGTANPGNLDALSITATGNIIAGMEAIIA